ncbi:MAG: L-threonylcarbamoyladenylate synthase [Spirochaetaceae bacterium]|jgi:tRNA threonylcarbamoyl adenosine modification protein (Sua5/YciO/YrdC/YwlC family)|nr:L-threonylcarbamoyladenylate synthase [Spirochaetaceae bacterium]
MIEYIVSTNIDDRIIAKGARLLSRGRLLAVPTDTSWSVVCSLQSPEGIKRLRSLSGERDERHFTLLCAQISQFGELCSLDNTRFRLIKRLTPGPYVFILKTLLGTEKTLGRKEIGVRIPHHPAPLALIKALGQPLYSITAKRAMVSDFDGGYNPDASKDSELPPIPEDALFEEAWELETLGEVDLILDPGEERPRIFSSILDISGGEVRLLRAGAGAWPLSV